MTMFYDDGSPVDPLDELEFAREDALDAHLALCKNLDARGLISRSWTTMPDGYVFAGGECVHPSVAAEIGATWDAYIDAVVADELAREEDA